MADEKRNRLKQWLESGEATLHPLTFSQRELWETSAVPPGDPANHICCVIHFRGALQAGDSEKALHRVAERQEALRTSFLPGKDRPLQMVRKSLEPDMRHRKLSGFEATDEGVEEAALQIFREPFDMVRGPLYRVAMLSRSETDHVIAFAIHHTIADGWSLGVFVQDLFSAYIGLMTGLDAPLPPVPLPHTAWGAAERAFWTPDELARRAEYWRKTLAGICPLWEPHKPQTPLHRWVTSMPPEMDKLASDLARRGGATKFNVLLTCFQLALARHTGKEDIVVGTPAANRTKQNTRETMGYFSSVVPLRTRIQPDRSFAETLSAVREHTVESFANAMPFAELAKALGEPSIPGTNPIFQVRFALQNHPVPDVELPGISARLRMRSTGTARFDLGCEITEVEDGLEVVWLHRPDMFSQAEIEMLDKEFRETLTAAADGAGKPATASLRASP